MSSAAKQSWEPARVLRSMNRASRFPANTDPSSRHAALMAEALIRHGEYPMLTEEPEHCGVSIAVTVSELWRARNEIERLKKRLAR